MILYQEGNDNTLETEDEKYDKASLNSIVSLSCEMINLAGEIIQEIKEFRVFLLSCFIVVYFQ